MDAVYDEHARATEVVLVCSDDGDKDGLDLAEVGEWGAVSFVIVLAKVLQIPQAVRPGGGKSGMPQAGKIVFVSRRDQTKFQGVGYVALVVKVQIVARRQVEQRVKVVTELCPGSRAPSPRPRGALRVNIPNPAPRWRLLATRLRR